MNAALQKCEQAAKTAGKLLLTKLGAVVASEKARHDLVTEADLNAQAEISRLLLAAFPDHLILGEEDPEPTNIVGLHNAFVWMIDPLDGTTNFVHGFPHFCVSIALTKFQHGVPTIECGTIFDPTRDECFSAVRGEGATLNGASIHVSQTRRLGAALLAASLPPIVERTSPELDDMIRVMMTARSVRRTGSAALNLAYLATGRLDGYWATTLSPWDAAAGALLVNEAGGKISNPSRGDFDPLKPRLVAAGTEALHQELLVVVGD